MRKKESNNVCTAKEMAAAVGWTMEELNQRFEEYERGDWHLEPATKIYKGSAADYINGNAQSARACFVFPSDESNAAEEGAGE